MHIRLNKFLSDSGVCSRRKADEHILAGKVLVNGEKAEVGQKIDPDQDQVTIGGQTIEKRIDKCVYYALNKPRGVISTASDEKGRQSVLDLVPKNPRVFPVGRLDKESEGLIILTNDGELTNILTHPSYKHEKEYVVTVSCRKNHVLGVEQIESQLKKGFMIDGNLMKADIAKVSIIHNTRYLILLTIHTGYNRQIRKMCDKMGLEVLKLKRTRIGELKLEDLDIEVGEYKVIKKNDVI